jgi:pyruvate dehydrogenase E2 component (dihydrolipoamide acetyltransferase)
MLLPEVCGVCAARVYLCCAGTAAILAVGGSKPTVVATADGLIGVRKVMQVNITADHRIVYGADAAEFLQSLKHVVENPDSLLL